MTPERERLLDQLLAAYERECQLSNKNQLGSPYFRAMCLWARIHPEEVIWMLLDRLKRINNLHHWSRFIWSDGGVNGASKLG